jgi:predicted RNase H-like HicB family nuclease
LFSILLSGILIIFAANLNPMNRNYRINLRREPEGGYTVFVPSLPGCITYSETVDEAIDMAKEAIGLYIDFVTSDLGYGTNNGNRFGKEA